MWLVSQDLKRVVDCTTLFMEQDGDKFYILNQNGNRMGIYTTEENAKTVMNQIIAHIREQELIHFSKVRMFSEEEIANKALYILPLEVFTPAMPVEEAPKYEEGDTIDPVTMQVTGNVNQKSPAPIGKPRAVPPSHQKKKMPPAFYPSDFEKPEDK